MAKHAWMAASAAEYEAFGLTAGAPALWEDGLRTNGEKGSYEWWYFDSKLSDGSSLVIAFHTGPVASFSAGFRPYATFTLTAPDGTRQNSKVHAAADDAEFCREQCDVRIGACTFRGDLHRYVIHFEDSAFTADVELVGSVPAWRPHSGHIVFGRSDYFAWLPAVPEGSVTAVIRQDGAETRYTGTGYHDHNWGNAPMFFLMHHWYWGRAKIGPYQVVSSYITAGKKYSYDKIPIFLLAKDGKILADQTENYLTYAEDDLFVDSVTHKHIANRIIYDYNDGTQHYRITYRRECDLERMGMETQLTRTQYAAVWLMGLRGSYHRMAGTVTLERLEHGKIAERWSAPALWEQMYFGKDRVFPHRLPDR